jgi:protein-tyrosine phosphatase
MTSDLAVIKSWNPRAIVTLLEEYELKMLGVSELPGLIAESGMEWYHLPIRDGSAPGEHFEHRWARAANLLTNHLYGGERVLIHCRGGLGRTGTVAAKLLFEAGLNPRSAIRTVRKARKGAIQTAEQEAYVRNLDSGLRTGDAGAKLINLVGDVRLGSVQKHGSIAIQPLFSDSMDILDYRTVNEVIDSKDFQVTELNEQGSVPRLAVRNDGVRRVLMVGGEELVGAKQNRVINTTIMVLPCTTLEIPVSCTEQGRWSYAAPDFNTSQIFMPRATRLNNKLAVDRTLAERGSYVGHQGGV